MSSSESAATHSDTEYPDYVHECLKYVAIHSKGAFSCGSSSDDGDGEDEDDDDDEDDCGDEDVKRISAGHNEREPVGRETVNFSPAYEAAKAAAAAAAAGETEAGGRATRADDYADWDEALGDASAVYPPLGASRAASGASGDRRRRWDGSRNSGLCGAADGDDCRGDGGGGGGDDGPTARELRKCLEGALYGQDLRDFVVAQPYCVANKNLDFGKPKMSEKAMRDSRNKVENWMSRYDVGSDEDATPNR